MRAQITKKWSKTENEEAPRIFRNVQKLLRKPEEKAGLRFIHIPPKEI